MQDICQLGARSAGAADDFGVPAEVYTYGQSLYCGYRELSPRELQGMTEVARFDGELRLPVDTAIDDIDRVRITHRYGVALATPRVYELAGDARRGPSGLVVQLVEVTDGS